MKLSIIIPILPVLWVQTHIRSVRGEALSRASGEVVFFISWPALGHSRPNPCTATIPSDLLIPTLSPCFATSVNITRYVSIYKENPVIQDLARAFSFPFTNHHIALCPMRYALGQGQLFYGWNFSSYQVDRSVPHPSGIGGVKGHNIYKWYYIAGKPRRACHVLTGWAGSFTLRCVANTDSPGLDSNEASS